MKSRGYYLAEIAVADRILQDMKNLSTSELRDVKGAKKTAKQRLKQLDRNIKYKSKSK